MSAWLESAVARAGSVSDWLSPKRQISADLLTSAQWPSRKVEDWKYTSVKALERADLSVVASAANEVSQIAGLNSLDVTFIDGRLTAESSNIELPQGLSISSFEQASDEQRAWALKTYAEIKPSRHIFGLVNDVLAQEGVIIDVTADVKIERPLRLLQVINGGAEAYTRVLVRLAAGAKLTVVEQFVGNQLSFNNAFSEYDIADNAELEHYRFALQTGEAMNVGGSHFKLGHKSQLNSTLVGFGSNLARLDVDVIHGGEFAHAKMNAVYLLDGIEQFDLHSTIEHAQPNGTTEENVRGIVAEKSKAVFNGRIHIHRDAQKTLAELNNRNLLMSNKAEINTKPELEIYADDVRCAHGATIAEIDKKALYYLMSRGVSRGQAQVMLNFGFINELVDQMPNQLLAEWLRPQLRERFAQMEVL